MSTGDTRGSQLATVFNWKGKQGEKDSQRLAKRKREELISTILSKQTSTSTFTGENEVTETPFLGFTSPTDKQKEKIAFKCNHLKDKIIRYELHKDYWTTV